MENGDKYFGNLIYEKKDSKNQYKVVSHVDHELDENVIQKKHGYGELYYKNGHKYFGSFINDKVQGYGVWVCPEYRYYGMFNDGDKEGEG